jgi:hypothetical protein
VEWGDFPWESGAKTHGKTMGRCAPPFSGLISTAQGPNGSMYTS